MRDTWRESAPRTWKFTGSGAVEWDVGRHVREPRPWKAKAPSGAVRRRGRCRPEEVDGKESVSICQDKKPRRWSLPICAVLFTQRKKPALAGAKPLTRPS